MTWRKVGSKEVQEIIKELRRGGWRIERRQGHVKAFAPDGRGVVTIPTSPSDHRALANLRSHLRRLGKVT